MSYKYLETREEKNVLVIILSREKSLNALTHEMIKELRHLFTKLNHDPGHIKGVVITGRGSRAFAAGADIKELIDLNEDSAYSVSLEGHKTMELIEKSPFPVIAAINGYALGGGFEVALACHIRVADTTAQMGLPEATLGLLPGYGGTQRLIKIIGRAQAIELMCSGDMIKAPRALEMGIVSYVTTPGLEVTKSIEIISNMTKNAPTSVSKILQATRLSLYNDEEGYRFERKAFSELINSPNGKEGMKAFIEKRKPEFK